MKKRKIQTFIFDFDGTLAILNINFQKLKEKILLIAENYISDIELTSLPLLELVDSISERIQDEQKSLHFKMKAYNLIQQKEIEAARSGALFDFTIPILTFLMNNGYSVGIVTRNCQEAVKTVFPNIDSYCHVFIPRELATWIKPDPRHIVQAMKNLNANANSTIVIGDHPIDIKAGNEAGTLTGGVSSGKISANRLKEAGADYVANNCLHLFRILNSEKLIHGFRL